MPDIPSFIKEFFDLPYGQDGTRQGLSTSHYTKDGEDYPYDDETVKRMGSSDDDSVMRGFYDDTLENEEDEDEDQQVWHSEDPLINKESVDIAGAGGQNLGFEFMAAKDREERKKQWSHGDKFYDDDEGDFSNKDKAKDDNYKEESRGMNKNKASKILRTIFEHEARKKIVEDVKKNLLEKAPPGKYPETGTSYEKVVKGIKKSGSDVNPWAVAWDMKNKGKKECKSVDELKEFVDNYMKEMGFTKAANREKCDIWKRKKGK